MPNVLGCGDFFEPKLLSKVASPHDLRKIVLGAPSLLCYSSQMNIELQSRDAAGVEHGRAAQGCEDDACGVHL